MNPLDRLWARASDRGPLVVAAAVFALLMLLSTRYGFHRDELYFLDAGRHLQGGYVDQPVFAPLVARLTLDLFGASLVALRVWPALAAAATVVVAARITRELGGDREAQLLSSIGVATMPVLLAVDHLEGPTAFDILAWSSLALVVVRIGRTRDPRLWVVAGATLGAGLTNKHSVAFFAIAFTAGTMLSGGAGLIMNRWFLAGAMVAVAFTLPDLIWQAQHGWATVTMTRHLHEENGGTGNIASWFAGQIVMTTIPCIAVWLSGLRHLWRSNNPTWRGLVWAYGLLFVFFALTTGAQIYYLAGAYVYLIAAGAIPLREWIRGGRRRRVCGALITALATVAAIPLVLPVLPASEIGWLYGINQAPAETVGWPELVQQVHRSWAALSPAQKRHAVIFTLDYGEAGAINELGRNLGLPRAVSGHNNEWWWGPGNRNALTVLVVAPGPRDVTGYRETLLHLFRHVDDVATLSNRAGLDNEEWHGHIFRCTSPVRPWGELWRALRHYD